MKVSALLLMVSVAIVGFGQTKMMEKAKAQGEMKATKLHGYVVDHMCAKGMLKKNNPMERAAKHTKECALEEACAASGYGLMYGDGKWLKFDEKGNQMAKKLFETSKKDNDFMADVTGQLKGDMIAVATLTESMMSTEEMKGKIMKSDDAHHDHK